MKIALATCAELIHGTQDDALLKTQLEKLGHATEFKVWNDTHVEWKNFDQVLLRSTWDYHRHLPQFLAWCGHIESVSTLTNPLSIVRWNSSKIYLSELRKKSVPTIETIIATTPESAITDARALIKANNEIVLKPAVSATAELTYRIENETEAVSAIDKILKRSELILQPFVRSIETDGEVSLIFFGSNYSHAVRKRPKQGDFRVQMDFGGNVEAYEASQELIALAGLALREVPAPSRYARVDIVDWAQSPKISELELIEPELFFRFSTESAYRFAHSLM
jgi:glutathione synthase/RimK-type ligase-like ATP-grasp enzyme